MRVNKLDDIDIYQEAFEIQQIGNEAVERVIKENKEKGIPIVFSKDGVIYYELPNGEITTKSPFEEKNGTGEKTPSRTNGKPRFQFFDGF